MAKYDKYEPRAGGFRATLAADLTKTSAGNPIGVGLNSSGQVVPGAGNSGIQGVLCTTKDMKAGDVVDVMTSGEVTDCVSPIVAGTLITADTTTGALGVTAASASKIAIGFAAEAARLIVRV
jgi:hypothetical protein